MFVTVFQQNLVPNHQGLIVVSGLTVHAWQDHGIKFKPLRFVYRHDLNGCSRMWVRSGKQPIELPVQCL